MNSAQKQTRRIKLSKEKIYDAALKIINRDGVDALSMRRLADELSVGTMTLYGYVKNKEELVEDVINYALPETFFQNNSQFERSYREQIELLALQLHDASQAHGKIIEMLILTTFSCPSFNRFRNNMMGLLLKLGLSKRETVHACVALTSYVMGFAIIEKTRSDPEPSFANSTSLPKINSERYPYLAIVEKERKSAISKESFLYGLNKLLDSIIEPDEQSRPGH